jgi:hypothetical protein
VHNPLLVKRLQSKHNVGGVEPRVIFIHATLQVLVQRPEVTARVVLERQEQMGFRLKCIVHAIEQFSLLACQLRKLFQNSAFTQSVLHLLLLYDLFFVEHFERKEGVWITLEAHQEHLTVLTVTEVAFEVEIVNVHRIAAGVFL